MSISLQAQTKPDSTLTGRPALTVPNFTIRRAAGLIEVDGRLDDAGWAGATDIPVDIEIAPGDNVPAPVKAICHVTFDQANLYLGCRAGDPDPGSIRGHMLDRDNVSRLVLDDLIGMYVDPFNDHSRAFVFIVNPLGVQADGVKTVAGGGEDYSWDAIWASAGRITADGYEVELAIPFKSLHFPHTTEVQTWGFVFVRSWPRNLRHRMESGPYQRGNTCDLCQASRVTGITGVSPGRNVQLTPTITAGRTDLRSVFPAGPLDRGSATPAVGLDLHLGVTPNVSLNAAVNPDFSQVEADVAQLDVNRRFALSYPEKRPFFLEGADFFQTPVDAVFTRTVADPDAGVKLTGKLGGSAGSAFGIFAARDNLTNILVPSNQSTAGTTLEQEAWTAVGRFRRDLGSASHVGLLYTGRVGTGYLNQVGGVDLFYRLGPATRVTAQYLTSLTEYPDSIASGLGQRRGTFTGGAGTISLKHDSRRFHASVSYLDLSPEFRADVGFVPRVDVRTFAFDASPTVQRGGGWLSFGQLGPFASITRDHGGMLTDQDLGLGLAYQGPLQSDVYLQVFDHRERFGGALYRFGRTTGYLGLKPASGLGFTTEWQIGGAIDYVNGRQVSEVTVAQSVQLSLGRGLTVDGSNTFQRLGSHGRRVLTANIAQTKLAYNFSLKTQVRAIVQYRAVRRNPTEYSALVDPKEDGLLGQFLFSHRVNPQTVVFLGYSETGIGTSQFDLTKQSRTFFAKLGYAWRP